MNTFNLCLFASAPDMDGLAFPVRVLTGELPEIAETASAWGYDGIEYLPNPERLPDEQEVRRVLRDANVTLPVINSGRLHPQGMALLHADEAVRERSIRAYEGLIDLAGALEARVGLGMARGPSSTTDGSGEQVALEVFRHLAEHAERAGAVIMLEPADPGSAASIHTVAEAMSWVSRVDSPAFSVMLDTYQLAEAETSVVEGIRAAGGAARHIHLYDPSRWPPGVRSEEDRLDWPTLVSALVEEGFAGSGSVVLAPTGDPGPAARTAARFLRGLFDTATQAGRS